MIRFVVAALFSVFAVLPAKAVEIQEVTSPGGIQAWLVQEDSIPFLSLEIRFLGGSALDPKGKRGVTNLMTALIEEGAGNLDATAFAEARDGLAASMGFRTFNDALSVSARAAISAVCSAGFASTQLPAANAAAICPVKIASGKFHGEMQTMMPSGPATPSACKRSASFA